MGQTNPTTSQKVEQLIAEWEAMIGSYVPRPLQPHMAISLHGMKQVLQEVKELETRPIPQDQPEPTPQGGFEDRA